MKRSHFKASKRKIVRRVRILAILGGQTVLHKSREDDDGDDCYNAMKSYFATTKGQKEMEDDVECYKMP